MTRRPRPAHRLPPAGQHGGNARHSKAQAAKQARPKAADFMSESEDAVTPEIHHDDLDSGSDDQSDSPESGSDGEEDIDAPRVVQWVDDDQLVELQAVSDVDSDGSPSGSDSRDGQDEGYLDDEDDDDARDSTVSHSTRRSQKLRSLKEDLSTLPLGTLRNAQRSLARTQVLSDTDDDTESDTQDEADKDDAPSFPSKDKSRSTQRDIAKRANKHAPTEVTSKRPVSRRRVVVDDHLPKPRDPRFAHSAGQYDPSQFKRGYDFLSGLRKDELSTLRENLKRARKLVVNSPAHLRAEREQEVERLERAMKRTESAVNTDDRERVELKAIQTAKQSEKEKRKQGKNEWWMKRSEKKQLLAKARLEAIAAVGGKQAVKKAVEKKQKRASQKAKKMRPFPRSEAVESSGGKRRRPVGSSDATAMKRRRVV